MNPLLAAAVALTLAACTSPRVADSDATRPTDQDPDAMMLFDFDDETGSGGGADRWQIQNDGVMGGRSEGRFAIADGALAFTGTLVTRGGGFSSVLTETDVDLSDYEGVELRVRGGGRTFAFAVHDGRRDRGREVWRRAPFPTTEEWTRVRVPFADLKATAHGEPVDVPPLDRAGVELLGFYIIDGIDGTFRLEVDEVRCY